eukprot:SM000013S26561  [mRNA]  locus=s13:1157890:1159152:+ [translate_table: standard]
MQRQAELHAAFFRLPRAAKLAVARDAGNSRGYFDDELTKRTRDWKEGFDFGAVPRPDLPHDDPRNAAQDGLNRWPAQSAGFRETMWEYMGAMEGVAERLMEAIAASLGLPRAEFARFFAPAHSSFARLNHYPPCPDPSRALGVSRHKDAGALTVLAQGTVPGLQVLKAGSWAGVDPHPGALVVNIGDMMQIWTNGLYKAPLHRVVVHVAQERDSVPYFYNPAFNAVVAPLPAAVAASSGKPLYHPVRWGEYRLRRYEGDFADVGEEVQIDDFHA